MRLRIKTIGVFTALLGCWPGLVLAQTTDELVEDARTTDDVITQSMGSARGSSVAGPARGGDGGPLAARGESPPAFDRR